MAKGLKREAPVLNPKRPPLAGSAVLLCVAAGLAPIIGGKLVPDPQPLEPGVLGVIGSILGGGQVPVAATFAITTLVCGAFAWHWARTRVVQIPFPNLGLCAGLLAAMIVVSVGYSPFKGTGLGVASQWLAMVLAFFAAAACLGRGRGPTTLLGSLVAGCTVTAALGILEFQATRALDPTWRIFSTWTNPNALAGMLLLGLFGALGFLASKERVGVLAAGAAFLLIGFAIALTQSKGAFVAVLIGFAGFAFYLLFACRPLREARRFVAPVLVSTVLLAAVVAVVALRKPETQRGSGPGLLSRIQGAQATQDQSAGYRVLLWKGAIELVRTNPVGWGAGSYRFYSTRPGLTPQTQNPHNGYLQVAVESGLIAGVLLLVLGGLWLREAFRGARSMPADTVLLRAGVVAAFLSSAAHNVVDSDLYYAGSGFGIFLLIGAGLALFGDALTPEQPHRLSRATALVSAAIALAMALIALQLDLAKANALWLRERGDFDGAIARLDAVSMLESFDGEVPAIRAALVPPEFRMPHLRRAASLAPSPKNLRALARELASRKEFPAAERALREALTVDPNNLLALSQLLELQVEMGSPISAEQTARRVVAVEGSPYYRVRAIPEIVPTETLSARLFLARREPDAAQRIELLEPAVVGYLEYADRTLPMIRNGLAETPPVFVPGERPEQASKRLLDGAAAAELLAAAYRTSGMAREAEGAASSASRLREAAASLPVPNR